MNRDIFSDRAFEVSTQVNIKTDTVNGWVTISPLDCFYKDSEVFLQGDDGHDFIDKAQTLFERLGDVTLDECIQFYAHDYLDLIFQS